MASELSSEAVGLLYKFSKVHAKHECQATFGIFQQFKKQKLCSKSRCTQWQVTLWWVRTHACQGFENSCCNIRIKSLILTKYFAKYEIK